VNSAMRSKLHTVWYPYAALSQTEKNIGCAHGIDLSLRVLWAQGNAEAAIQVEKLGNQLVKTYDMDILCGYSLSHVQGGMDSHIFQRICAEHSAVYSR
jgi:hypothetical protein